MDTDSDTDILPVVQPSSPEPIPVRIGPKPDDEPALDHQVLLPVPVEGSTEVVAPLTPEGRGYPSLYDTKASTIVAVMLGMLIVGGIQLIVHNIHKNAKTDYRALTQFVTMMVALVLGAYMADLLIAGPDTSLLSDDEHTIILGFVKDICLMVFSYYFGTRSASGKGAEE